MNKRLVAMIIIATLVGIASVACSKKTEETNMETPISYAVVETNENEEESGGIVVDENLFTVELIIPQNISGDLSDFDRETYLKENEDFLDAELTATGDLKIKMTKKKHQEMLDEIKKSVEITFEELIGGEDTPYIKNVTFKNDFKEVTITVDKSAYENAFDLTPLMVGMSVAMYQVFSGEEFDCNIKVVDETTNEVLNDINYPEDLDY